VEEDKREWVIGREERKKRGRRRRLHEEDPKDIFQVVL
jgi:hypothetical protein